MCLGADHSTRTGENEDETTSSVAGRTHQLSRHANNFDPLLSLAPSSMT